MCGTGEHLFRGQAQFLTDQLLQRSFDRFLPHRLAQAGVDVGLGSTPSFPLREPRHPIRIDPCIDLLFSCRRGLQANTVRRPLEISGQYICSGGRYITVVEGLSDDITIDA